MQNSPMGFVEQILLIVFMLMIFVGIAGGRPDSVLKPLFDILGHVVGAIITVLGQLLIMLVQLVARLIGAGFLFVFGLLQSHSSNRGQSMGSPSQARKQ